MISEYMKCVEDWARGYNANNPNSALLDFFGPCLMAKSRKDFEKITNELDTEGV